MCQVHSQAVETQQQLDSPGQSPEGADRAAGHGDVLDI